MATAFDPYRLAGRELANRIVMAPMTRSRASGADRSPTALTADYYAQRAGAGLIITEGTQPSATGQGYVDTPGIHSPEQTAAWRQVTDAVHDRDGVIYLQLLHTGRIGHPSLAGEHPVAPSAIAAKGATYTADGPLDFVVPHALTEAEIVATINDFVEGARNAVEAGFDGVELHGANGYLIHQFLATAANRRDDDWGGSVDRRIRFAVETAAAVSDAIGADKVGLRISPGIGLGDLPEDDEADREKTYTALLEGLAPLNLAYLHLTEASGVEDLGRSLRAQWESTFILNPFTRDRPTGPEDLHLIEDGATDLLSFGALFLANPDLPARLKAGGPFNEPDRSTYYGGDHRGYTDYPSLG